MKKIIGKILCAIFLISSIQTVSYAKTGDIIGYAKYSDISVYINHYPIESFTVNNYTAVFAEDLQNYGFNVVWNSETRSVSITRNEYATEITPYGTVYKYSYIVGQDSFPLLETDISAYINGQPVNCACIDGKTCIYVDDLAPYGEIAWVPEVRAVKIWIDGLPIKDYATVEEASVVQQLGIPCYEGTDIPDFGKFTGAELTKQGAHNSLWYNAGFERTQSYEDILEKCGWKWTDTKFNKETYIDKNNTFKQRTTSYSKYYEKGNVRIWLMYFFKDGNLALTIN